MRIPIRSLAAIGPMALFAALCGLAASPALAEKATPATTMTSCEMTFSIKGWSAFYKTAKGEGQITCDNGQSASVKISTKGGGLTFGKSEVLDGEGTFSPVESIEKVFGSYATAEAHAGAVKSSSVQAMTKGEVSLALAGTGQGFDLGVSFGRFKITRK